MVMESSSSTNFIQIEKSLKAILNQFSILYLSISQDKIPYCVDNRLLADPDMKHGRSKYMASVVRFDLQFIVHLIIEQNFN